MMSYEILLHIVFLESCYIIAHFEIEVRSNSDKLERYP